MPTRTLTFNDALLVGGVSSLTGSLTIDFDANPPTVTAGTLTQSAVVGVIGTQTFAAANFKVIPSVVNGQTVYTLAARSNQTVPIIGGPTSNISIQFTGQTPTTNTATVTPTSIPTPLPYSGTVVVCFAEGTMIGTVHGPVPVESLQVGDLVVTASGALRPVHWLGHSVIDCAAEQVSSGVWPVRILAGAFGAGLPERDLYLSPGHPVLVGADEDGEGGHLVPIMCLINGTSIDRAPVDEITYWHVELDAHDIILAEGLPTESYLDWGDRIFFTEAADHALANPDFVVPGVAGRCRPVALDGPVVEAERRRLDAVFAMRLADACAWPDAADRALG